MVEAIEILVSIVVISLQWTNTRIAILRLNQSPSEPVLPSTYNVFHSMALGLREGRIGGFAPSAASRVGFN